MKDPIFMQIYEEYKKYILLGVFKPGDKLPSVREVADERGVNPHTVNRSYAMLEEDGYVETMFKKGSFVRIKKSESNLLEQVMLDFKKYKEEGLSEDDLLKMMRKVYGEKND